MRQTLIFCAAALASLVAAERAHDACSAVSNPAPCGISSDSQQECEARGCCYNSAFKQSPCFYPGADAVPIKYVHIVQACHFDAGFADSTVGILNRWWYQHFPQAVNLGHQLAANSSLPATLQTNGLHFMAQSYIVSLFLDCPPNIPGLPCPSAELVANVTDAIQRGWITWHAFPYNGEAELMSASTLSAGIALTHALDARFGLPPKATMSQRDVPSTTRSIIPVLLQNGVTLLSEGVNGASEFPVVPRMFRWHDSNSGLSMPYMLHPFGYGATPGSIAWDDIIVIPGHEHAFVPDWRGDNAGPPQSVKEVLTDWNQVSALFPGASVFYSTFDNFSSTLTQDVLDLLPVIDSEIADTWIHGSASDPWKGSWFKRAQSAREACIASGACDASDPAVVNATRHILKNGEHTWGRDIKTFLHDQTNWTNAQLAAVLAANASNFITTRDSWDEQRYFGIELAMEALPAGHPLQAALMQAWQDIHPAAPPSTSGWTPAATGPTAVQTVGKWSVALDSKTGALGYLTDTQKGVTWANASMSSNSSPNPTAPPSMLGWVHYQTYTGTDYTNFMDSYCSFGTNPPSWFLLDFGKPNVSSANPVHYEVDQSLVDAWERRNADGGLSFLVHAQLSPDGTDILHTYYGAPADIWTQWDVPGAGNANQAINVSLALFDKTGTRLPESLFFRFNPAAVVGAAVSPTTPGLQQDWYAMKIAQPVDVSDVQAGGNRHSHGVTDGVLYSKADASGTTASLRVTSGEAYMATFGHPTGFPVPSAAGLGPFDPSQGEGASFYLMGNIWGTNYPVSMGVVVPAALTPRPRPLTVRFSPFAGVDSLACRGRQHRLDLQHHHRVRRAEQGSE